MYQWSVASPPPATYTHLSSGTPSSRAVSVSVSSRAADGYYGWEEAAPFDKIIVTCGIDHIPPPLLQQLKAGGTMVIPVGPPGAQHILKVVKDVAPAGQIAIKRSDIYAGRPVPFVPFTKLDGEMIKGTH